MRAVVITKHGGPEVLQVQERPDPALGPGEVRIGVAAAGINFADVMARMGLYPDAPKHAVRGRLRGRWDDSRAGGGAPSPTRSEQRPARARRHAVRRLRLAGRGGRRRRRGAARAAQLRAGRGDPRQLRHRLGGADRLRQPAAGRARAGPLRRRRRGHRRDADRQAQRRRGLRHRLAGQARAHHRARRGPRARLHPAGLGARPAEVRRDPRRGRRQELPSQLWPAAPGRPAGGLRRLLGRLGRAEKRRCRAARGRCACRAST